MILASTESAITPSKAKKTASYRDGERVRSAAPVDQGGGVDRVETVLGIDGVQGAGDAIILDVIDIDAGQLGELGHDGFVTEEICAAQYLAPGAHIDAVGDLEPVRQLLRDGVVARHPKKKQTTNNPKKNQKQKHTNQQNMVAADHLVVIGAEGVE